MDVEILLGDLEHIRGDYERRGTFVDLFGGSKYLRCVPPIASK